MSVYVHPFAFKSYCPVATDYNNVYFTVTVKWIKWLEDSRNDYFSNIGQNTRNFIKAMLLCHSKEKVRVHYFFPQSLLRKANY